MAKPFKTAKRLALGAAVAGAAGFLAGLLTAPKSGRETREELLKSAGKTANDVEAQLKNLHAELADLIDETREKGDELNGKAKREFNSLADLAKDSKNKAQDVLKSAKKGELSDKDLQKAITDAKHAIDHLKDFLKK